MHRQIVAQKPWRIIPVRRD